MCGINGIYAYHYAANPIDRVELVRTRDQMARRGPDGSGLWVSEDERVGLAHRRLAIIDPSENGRQPMGTSDGRFVVTFNGEIYNYKDIRRKLEAKDYVFRTQSDTEVLLHLYADQGQEMVHALRGMFAFAIWDSLKRELLLARDPYGIKPLYYADDGWSVRFASQVKALLAGEGLSRDHDPAGQVGFFLFGNVPEPFTMYRAIRALPAGTTVRISRIGCATPQHYFSVAETYCRAVASPAGLSSDLFREALRESVRSHLVADVSVGAFLSAGIDSGALVGLMRDVGASDLKSVTIGFEEYRGRPEDETPLAAEIARQYGTDHTERFVTRAEFAADLPKILEAMDQPSIDGVNTWFVSKAAHEIGLKVAISGLGGDELLGGYPSFRDIPKWVSAFAIPSRVPLLGAASRRIICAFANALGISPKAAGLIEYGGTYAGAYLLRRGLFMPWELGELLERETVADGLERLAPRDLILSELHPRPPDAFARVSALESGLYMRNQLLRDTDWASMAHSLEVRVPLVDSVLLRSTAPYMRATRGREGKAALAYAPSQPLPEAVVMRRKTGFTTPIHHWTEGRMATGNNRPNRARKAWARNWGRIVGRMSDATALSQRP
jgi:asparagine synthase (glutamine-hydrolysing)